MQNIHKGNKFRGTVGMKRPPMLNSRLLKAFERGEHGNMRPSRIPRIGTAAIFGFKQKVKFK